MTFLDYLLEKKALKKDQFKELKEGIEKDSFSLEELILKKKFLDEEELFKLKSQYYKISLKKFKEEKIPFEVLELIPKESIEFYKILPLSFDKKERILEIGMVFPEDIQAQEALKFLARQQKFSLKTSLITLSDFKKYLESYQAPEREVIQALEKLKEEIKVESKQKKVGKEVLEKLVEEAPIIKMVGVILRQAIEGNASDIHIEPTPEKIKIRYRLHGVLYSSLFLPLKILPAIVARIKILAGLKIDETRLPQDGRFSTTFGDREYDFRVSTFPTNLGEKIAIRILDPSQGIKSLEELGLRGRNLKIIQETVKKPYGLVLVSGPTGCGKTTTLYSLLQILNQEEVNIVTLEDPIEYSLLGINQSQINPQIGYTFARGLRQILRQDPDIIMVGEIRDNETANLAIHAALTGHLVLSTLHTSNVITTIPRLIDMEIKPFLIPPTLILSINQRLIRTLCSCKKEIKASKEQENIILTKIENLSLEIKDKSKAKPPFFIYQAKGCKQCNFRGYSGRIGIYEILIMTDNLAKIILENCAEAEILKEAKGQGMITMFEDGLLKVLDGITSFEEVIRISEET